MTKKIHINYEQLKGHVQDIIRQINLDNWKPDYVVGITRGGLLPAVLISQYLNIPMHTLKVSLRDGEEEDCDHNCWMAEDAFGYEGGLTGRTNTEYRLNILVVDDINDSGATIAWIKKDWQTGCLPDDPAWSTVWGNNVRFAVVVNNLASKEEITYHSMEVNKAEDPCWIVFPVEDWWNQD
jgi:hypoxanthine phosphoribosyltransferase